MQISSYGIAQAVTYRYIDYEVDRFWKFEY